MSRLDRMCVLSSDEVKSRKHLVFEKKLHQISGFVNLGPQGRRNCVTNHALVCMAQDINKKWKHQIGYFFTKGTTGATHLVSLIIRDIMMLFDAGLEVGAINYLLRENHNTEHDKLIFNVLGKDIVVLDDVQPLLKLTRNCLSKYDILYGCNKVAKYDHIKSCYEKDR